MTDIAVVIPARNAGATIGRTLEALSGQSHAPDEVVVVDDGSTDDTVAIAERAGVRVLRQDAQGPAQARNRGAAATSAPLLAFTDADCYPSPEWLAAGVRALERADLVQGGVRPERPPGPFDRTLWVERRSGLWESANVLVRRELFEALGGFEEWIVPSIGKAFGEDMWLGWRAFRAGAALAFAPDALVEHAVFERGPLGYAEERRRLRYFLNAATREFDLALAGAALAAARRAPAPLVLAAPFAARVARRAWPHRRRAPQVAAAEVAAHAVGFYSLALGSIRHRSPVL